MPFDPSKKPRCSLQCAFCFMSQGRLWCLRKILFRRWISRKLVRFRELVPGYTQEIFCCVSYILDRKILLLSTAQTRWLVVSTRGRFLLYSDSEVTRLFVVLLMMAKTSLPPGFRFCPADVELVMYHLKRKVTGKNVTFEVISELNIYKYAPWDLPDKSCLRSKDLEWFFFCPKGTKYASGARVNRATDGGYWKATGKDRQVSYNSRTVGMIKTLVFHTGHPPKGDRTDWVMYEYKMLDKKLADAGVVQDAFVLCKVLKKSGLGVPKSGAQYGASFNEDDYDDDGEICAESSVAQPPPALHFNNSVFHPGSTSSGPLCSSLIFSGSTGPLSDSVFVPGSTSNGPLSDPGLSKAMLSADEVPPPIPDISENIISMMGMFIPDSPGLLFENDNNEADTFGHVKQNEGSACSDGNDVYSGLEDLDHTELCGGGSSLSGLQTTGLGLAAACLEQNDLNGPLYFPAHDMGSQLSLTDTPWAPFNCSQQNYCTIDSLGSVQLDSALNRSPLLSEASNGRGNEHAMQFQNRSRYGLSF